VGGVWMMSPSRHLAGEALLRNSGPSGAACRSQTLKFLRPQDLRQQALTLCQL
jgi:hypothetical protein